MSKYFAIEGNIYQVSSKAYELLILNVCFIVTAIPLVTIGSSLTTCYQLLQERQPGNQSITVVNYLKYFKQNLVKGSQVFILNVICLLAGTGLVIISPLFLRLVLLLFLAGLILLFQSLYPLLPIMGCSLKDGLKISSYLLLKHTILVISAFMFFIISFLILVFFQKLFIFWLCFGFSIPLFGSSQCYRTIFKKLNIL